jgi:hypothetical protein
MLSTTNNPQSTYENGASKQRIRKYWILWLGWAALVCSPQLLAFAVDDSRTDCEPNAVIPFVVCETNPNTGMCTSEYCTDDESYVTTDYSVEHSNLPFLAFLPNDVTTYDPHVAAFYSYQSDSDASSTAPTVELTDSSCGTVTKQTYRTTVHLATDATCMITVTPPQASYPYQHIVYTGTLSRTGNIYSLTEGVICGSPQYSSCDTSSPLPVPESPSSSDEPE